MAEPVDYLRDALNGLQIVPPAASPHAVSVDNLIFYLTAMSTFIVVLVSVLIFYFSVRYRATAEVDRKWTLSKRTIHLIEWGWTVPTLLVFLSFFYWGASLYVPSYRPPPGAIQVDVVGKQWMWKVEHQNGVREIDTLHVPVGQKIELRIRSLDVIHSFYIPAFRLKQDAVPGMVTNFWFEATRPGTYSLLCAEYCGRDHSRMRGRVIAMTPAAYGRWLERQPRPGSAASQGEALFRSLGCSGCHGPSSSVHAPSFDGLYGKPVHLRSGETKMADDPYIRDSILQPRKDVVAGYAPIMPSFQNEVSDADIENLIAYIKSLSDRTRPEQ
jgi:cytochrome c oxidase subunit 2